VEAVITPLAVEEVGVMVTPLAVEEVEATLFVG
jgi:hypothetical protein